MNVHRDGAVRVRASRTRHSYPVKTVTVDRRVWREAMRLSRGDARRIRIISARTAEIR